MAVLSGSQVTDQAVPPPSIRVQVPVDTRTEQRADSGTPAEFIQYIEVAPEELYRYL